MLENIIRTKDNKDRLINEIIELEYKMFDQVQNVSGRTNCQENKETFYVMRYSQQYPFSVEMLESYKEDLRVGATEGRNFLTEKYGYMMAYTDPVYFKERLETFLPAIIKEKEDVINQITSILMNYQKETANKYPFFSKQGRTSNDEKGIASIRIYTLGELKT